MRLLLAAKRELRPPPPQSKPGETLVRIVARATAPLTERYSDGSSLASDIREFLRGNETIAYPDNGLRKIQRSVKQRPGRVLGVVAAVILATLATWAWTAQQQRLALADARATQAEHSRAMAQAVAAVAAGSREIGTHLHWYEGVVEAVASSATMVLQGEGHFAGQIYHADAFGRPDAPATVAIREGHKPVSAHHPVYKLAPNTSASDVESDVRRLHLLTDHSQRAFSRAPHHPGPATSHAERVSRIHSKDNPLHAIYVGTTKGVFWRFPGTDGGWDEAHDHREDAWYADVVTAHGSGTGSRRGWTLPYEELVQSHTVVSCAQPILDRDGGLVGVAGIDLSYEHLRAQMRSVESIPGHFQSELRGPDGHLILGSNGAESPEVFPTPAGHRFSSGGEKLTIWSPIDPIGWTLVTRLGWTTLLRESKGSEP
ncbi:MAG: hypothetical protein ACI9OJ_002631 [Myxococcota bacterium]|jgi:hypothetical protein